MTSRQEIVALSACLLAAVLALLGMFAAEARQADAAQQRFVNERAVIVRLSTMCHSRPDGSAECDPRTFQPTSMKGTSK